MYSCTLHRKSRKCKQILPAHNWSTQPVSAVRFSSFRFVSFSFYFLSAYHFPFASNVLCATKLPQNFSAFHVQRRRSPSPNAPACLPLRPLPSNGSKPMISCRRCCFPCFPAVRRFSTARFLAWLHLRNTFCGAARGWGGGLHREGVHHMICNFHCIAAWAGCVTQKLMPHNHGWSCNKRWPQWEMGKLLLGLAWGRERGSD